ncbi:hypothetical protein B566_EDAN001798 [Ephemera danica]|nr:hypothetical protein B566_EDAN001798 [Ephemera danica]
MPSIATLRYRQGCVHGEELPYVFGAPLVGSLAHFPRNYTRAEQALAEAVIIYWSNFARTGNPNEPVEPDAPSLHAGRSERNRFKDMEWPAYEAVHKAYLILDTKPRLKNHYRAHRLSFWLNLVPDLHRPGGPDVPASHHQLDSQEETDPLRVRLPPLPSPLWPEPSLPLPGTPVPGVGLQGHHGSFNLTAAVLGRVTPDPIHHGANSRHNDSQHSASSSEQTDDGFAAYSTALSVTIAIGCSLLILNVLIFAGVYYQRDKHRIEIKKRNENGQMPNISGDLELTATSGSSSIKQQPPDPGGGGMMMVGGIVVQQQQQQTQLPPPEFADMLPPPPPAAVVAGVVQAVAPHHYHPTHHHHHGLPKPPPPPKSCGPPPDSQQMLPLVPPSITVSGTGTLQRSRQQASSQTHQQHPQQQQQQHHHHTSQSGSDKQGMPGARNTATLKKSNLHGKVSQLANNIEELRV